MVNINRRDTFESLQQRLTKLQRTATIKSGLSDPILGETIELLQCTLEALRTTEEQLRQREAELAQTRQLAQPEHQGLDQRLEQPELRYQQLEEALRATEERYRRLVEISFDAVVLHADGKIVEINSSGTQFYGATSPEELIGRSIYDFIHPDDLHLARQRIRDSSEKGQAVSLVEEKLIRLDRTVFDAEIATVPITYQDRAATLAVARNISRRKQAERALKESESRFRTLAETTSAALFVYQGVQFRYVNPAIEQITGYSQAELLAMDFLNIIHPDFRELVQERREKRQRLEPVPVRTEVKLLTKNGEERWVDITAGVIEFEGDVAVVGTAFDVTRVKQAELELERLLAQERRQRLSAETLGEVYLVLTAQVSYEAVLDEILTQVQHLVSYSAANLMMLDGYNLRPARWQGYESFGSTVPVQSLIDLPLDRKAVQTRQPLLVSDTRQNPDWVVMPETTWIRSFMAVPIYLRDQVLGLLRLDSDIPDKFSVEDIQSLVPLANAAALALENARLHDQARREIEERKQVAKELRRVAARTHTILDAIPDTMLFFSRNGQLLDCRIADERLVILGPGGVSARDMQLEEMLPPDLLHQIRARLVNMPSPAARPVFEYQLFSPAGLQDYEVRLVVSSLNEAIAIIRNITERKRAEREAVRTERLAALGRLAAALAHEINNPLQIIQSNLDLMLDYPSEIAKSEEYLGVIHRQINRLSDLTDRVLNLSRPQPSLRQQVDIVKLVQEVLGLTRTLIEQHHLQVTLEAQQVPLVTAVPHQLSQVFLNLVINAVEAIPEQGQLQVAIYPVDQEVAITFTSDSPAIPPHILPHIFDPFFTTKPEGSGLGLWVCHNLMEQNQGSLTVRNLTEAQGVIFTVKLPVAPAGS